MKKYTGIDISKAMLDSAKIMTSGIGRPLNCTYYEKTTNIIDRVQKLGEGFDMVVCSYTLTELTSDPGRLLATRLLFDTLEVNGLMVILEKGNPIGSHTVRTARKVLLDSFNEKINGKSELVNSIPPKGVEIPDICATVVAPCTHDMPCPLSPGLFCSFSQKVNSAMIRKASQEKFSYLVIQKQVRGNRSLNEWNDLSTASYPLGDTAETTSTSIQMINKLLKAEKGKLDVVVDELIGEVEWENYIPAARRSEWGRVVRSPLKRKRHTIIDSCSSDGSIKRSVISKKSVNYIEAFYIATKKTMWGGLYPVLSDASSSLNEPMIKSKNHLFCMVGSIKNEGEKVERGGRDEKDILTQNTNQKLANDLLSKERKVGESFRMDLTQNFGGCRRNRRLTLSKSLNAHKERLQSAKMSKGLNDCRNLQ